MTFQNHLISHIVFSSAKVLPQEYIFRPPILKLLKTDSQLNKNCLIHGDLNPENILIANNTPYVIDWDLCENGPLC